MGTDVHGEARVLHRPTEAARMQLYTNARPVTQGSGKQRPDLAD